MLGAMVVAAAAVLPSPAADSLPGDWAALSKGQVVVRDGATTKKAGAPAAEAHILVSRSPDKVWQVVSDPRKLMQEERKVRKIKMLSQGKSSQQVEFTVLMTRLLPTFNYVLQQDLYPPYLMKFHRVSGSFKDIQGSWKLTPVENGQKTILSYSLKIDPGVIAPRGIIMNAVKSDLPTMMRNAKAAIDKNSL